MKGAQVPEKNGFSDLGDKERTKVDEGNYFAKKCTEMAKLCMSRGIPYVLE